MPGSVLDRVKTDFRDVPTKSRMANGVFWAHVFPIALVALSMLIFSVINHSVNLTSTSMPWVMLILFLFLAISLIVYLSIFGKELTKYAKGFFDALWNLWAVVGVAKVTSSILGGSSSIEAVVSGWSPVAQTVILMLVGGTAAIRFAIAAIGVWSEFSKKTDTMARPETLRLTEEERAAFFDILVNSPEPNERLKRAVTEARRRVAS